MDKIKAPSVEERGGDRIDWAHAGPGLPLPELPDEDSVSQEAGYEPGPAADA